MEKDIKKPQIRFQGFTEEWEQHKLGDYCEMYNGDRSSKYPNASDMVDDGIPFINAGDLENGSVNLKTANNITREKYNQLCGAKLQIGDIVYCLRGTLGKNAFIDNFEEGTIASSLVAIRPKNIDGRYLYYILNSDIEYRQRIVHDEGAAQPNLSAKSVSEFEIPILSIGEQKKISEYFTKFDHLISFHQRKYDSLVKVKKSMLEKMFPRSGAKKPEIRFVGFTDDWEQRKIGEWGSFYYGHSCPKWSITEDANTPCIRYGELYTKFGAKIDKVFSYTNMPTDKLRFSKGTEVLIPRVGEDPMDYNHCAWLSMPDIAIGEMISVFNTEQNPLFTATMFNATLQKEFAHRVEGGSVTNLYFEKLKNIDVLYPSLDEQEKIATFFEKIDNLITLHQRKLNLLKNIKKAMLEKMFV